MDLHKEAYKEEAFELLTELEASLLELEENPGDAELVGRTFRAMHTIKGSGAMFGFENIATFMHEVEAVFDLVRDNKIQVTKEIVDLSLSSCDQVRKMVEGKAADENKVGEIKESLKRILDDFKEENQPEMGAPYETEDKTNRELTFRIRFSPDPEILKTGTNPLLLLDELRDLGECIVSAQVDSIPELKDIDPENCYFRWDIILTTREGIDAVRDVFIFVEDECEIVIDVVDEENELDNDTEYKKLGEILLDRGELSRETLQKTIDERKRIGESLVENGVIDSQTVESALVEQQHVRRVRERRKEAAMASSVRVAADKLDNLVDLVGELVTVQASLSQKALFQNDAELISIAEEVDRLTAELRDNTMAIRMLPIGTTLSKFRRLVRDLSNELGKDVALTIEGAETELDKTVIERLNDPMVHIIRNSMDHGIESPDIREAAGKPRQGRIHLSAEHSGANVLIKISDDGAGLNSDKIREKAIDRGLIAADSEMSEDEIFSQIFFPGFSTMEKATETSGRGVGMDVVKSSIEALRGVVEITSKKGLGTTITLKLPLTLAIIDGLLVEIGQTYFVLALSVVEECVELTSEDLARSNGRHIANVRGEMVPYVLLREICEIQEDIPDIEHIVIAEVNGNRIGFVVDQVIGEHQTVIKSLGKAYKDAKGFSGATILADGTVALILDVNKLAEIAEAEEFEKLWEGEV